MEARMLILKEGSSEASGPIKERVVPPCYCITDPAGPARR